MFRNVYALSHIQNTPEFYEMCEFFWLKICTCPSFSLGKSDERPLRTRDQRSVAHFPMKGVKDWVAKARWWREETVQQPPEDVWGTALNAGQQQSVHTPAPSWARDKHAPAHLRRALHTHTHPHPLTCHHHPLLFKFIIFTKIIQKRETNIFTKIHGWYST